MSFTEQTLSPRPTSYGETACSSLFSVRAVYPRELKDTDTGIWELWGIGKRFWRSCAKERKEQVEKVEGGRGPRAWGGSVASLSVLGEKGVCSGKELKAQVDAESS